MTATVGRGYTVLRRLLPLSFTLIEFCWAYPWLLLVTGVSYATSTPLLPPPSAFALLAGGFIAVRAVLARPWALLHTRIAVVGAGVVCGLAAVRATYYSSYAVYDLRWIGVLLQAAHDALPAVVPAVMGALAATVWWWRGVVLGEREFSYFEVDRAFRRGIGWSAVFIFFLALYGRTRGFALAQAAPAYLLAFFSLSLTVLAITRLLSLWEETQAEPAQALAANRHWLLLLVGVVGLIVVLAAVLAGSADAQIRVVLQKALRPLAPVVEFIFYVLFAVATVIARVIMFALTRLSLRRVAIPQPPASPSPSPRDLFRDLPPEVVSGARWGMVFLVIAVLVILLAISIVRARRARRRRDEDEHESVWSGEAVVAGLGAALRRLLARLQPGSGAGELRPVGVVRAIYREFLQLGAGLGVARPPHQTPLEYQPRFAERLPEGAPDAAHLTGIYIKARYAAQRPDAGEIAAAQQALNRVKDHAGLKP